MVLLLLIGILAVLQLVSLKAKIYQSPLRLVNLTAIEENVKWELIGRWGLDRL